MSYSQDFLADDVMQKLPDPVRKFLFYDAPVSFSPHEVLDLLRQHGEQGLMNLLEGLVRDYGRDDYGDQDHLPLSATPSRRPRRRRH